MMLVVDFGLALTPAAVAAVVSSCWNQIVSFLHVMMMMMMVAKMRW